MLTLRVVSRPKSRGLDTAWSVLLDSHGFPREPAESATFTVDLGQQLAQGPLHLPGAADKAGHDPQQFVLVLLPDHGDGLQDELHLLQLMSPWKAEPDSEISPGPVCCQIPQRVQEAWNGMGGCHWLSHMHGGSRGWAGVLTLPPTHCDRRQGT